MTEPYARQLLDGAWGTPLTDRYSAAWSVDPDGQQWPWLMANDAHGAEGAGCCCRQCAPHEQLGRLPRDYAGVFDLFCGRPTQAGAPCRQPVRRAGDACHAHKDRP